MARPIGIGHVVCVRPADLTGTTPEIARFAQVHPRDSRLREVGERRSGLRPQRTHRNRDHAQRGTGWPHALVRRLACVSIMALGAGAHAQEVGSRVPEEAVRWRRHRSPRLAGAGRPTPGAGAGDSASDNPPLDLLDRFRAMFSQKEDPDGPINTDRPTFTPANTVVPPGRLQFESGFTYNRQQSTATSNLYDLPELAMRYGLMDRVEFRMFWEGPTFASAPSSPAPPREPGSAGRATRRSASSGSYSPGDKDRKWIPTTALITSVIAPTGGTSPLSSGRRRALYQPDLRLEPHRQADPGRQHRLPGNATTADPAARTSAADNFQRFHQSLVAFYTVGERTTLFYEWYVLMFTNSAEQSPPALTWTGACFTGSRRTFRSTSAPALA